jgi:hypothetical protein
MVILFSDLKVCTKCKKAKQTEKANEGHLKVA